MKNTHGELHHISDQILEKNNVKESFIKFSNMLYTLINILIFLRRTQDKPSYLQ